MTNPHLEKLKLLLENYNSENTNITNKQILVEKKQVVVNCNPNTLMVPNIAIDSLLFNFYINKNSTCSFETMIIPLKDKIPCYIQKDNIIVSELSNFKILYSHVVFGSSAMVHSYIYIDGEHIEDYIKNVHIQSLTDDDLVLCYEVYKHLGKYNYDSTITSKTSSGGLSLNPNSLSEEINQKKYLLITEYEAQLITEDEYRKRKYNMDTKKTFDYSNMLFALMKNDIVHLSCTNIKKIIKGVMNISISYFESLDILRKTYTGSDLKLPNKRDVNPKI